MTNQAPICVLRVAVPSILDVNLHLCGYMRGRSPGLITQEEGQHSGGEFSFVCLFLLHLPSAVLCPFHSSSTAYSSTWNGVGRLFPLTKRRGEFGILAE